MTASAEAITAAAAPSGAAAVVPFWSRTSVRIVGGLVVPLAVLALWQAVTGFGLIPTYRLPAPLDVVNAAVWNIETRGSTGTLREGQ